MSFGERKVCRVKVINIFEENAVTIEKMVNKAIEEIEEQGLKVLDIQVTTDNIFFLLGTV